MFDASLVTCTIRIAKNLVSSFHCEGGKRTQYSRDTIINFWFQNVILQSILYGKKVHDDFVYGSRGGPQRASRTNNAENFFFCYFNSTC